MIYLKESQYHEILKHCLKSVPEEACGLLGGRIEGDSRIVEKVYLLTNTDHSPEHFCMDAKEQFAAIKDMRSHEWKLIGNFHSHPASPARPSEEDKRLAFDPEARYLILSLQNTSKAVLKAFIIKQGTVDEETIEIQEG